MAEQRVAIITAGGSGMGAAAARRLSEDGYEVAVLSSSGRGEKLGNELGGIGVTGSNQSNDDLQRLVDLTLERWGRIDVLVNSAGHGPRGPVLDLTDEDWHLGMEVYFLSAVRPARLVIPTMLSHSKAQSSTSRHSHRLSRIRLSRLPECSGQVLRRGPSWSPTATLHETSG